MSIIPEVVLQSHTNGSFWDSELPRRLQSKENLSPREQNLREKILKTINEKVTDRGSLKYLHFSHEEFGDLTFQESYPIDKQGQPLALLASSSLKLLRWKEWKVGFGIDVANVGDANAVGKKYGDFLIKRIFRIAQEVANEEGVITVRMGGDELGFFSQEVESLKEKKDEIINKIRERLNNTPNHPRLGPSQFKESDTVPNSHYMRDMNVRLFPAEERLSYFRKFYPWLNNIFDDIGNDTTTRNNVIETFTALFFDAVTYQEAKESQIENPIPVYIDRADVVKRLAHDNNNSWRVIRIDILGALKYINDNKSQGGGTQNYEGGDTYIRWIYRKLHEAGIQDLIGSDGFLQRTGADWYIYMPETPKKDTDAKKLAEDELKLTSVMTELHTTLNKVYTLADGSVIPLLTALSSEHLEPGSPDLKDYIKQTFEGEFEEYSVIDRELAVVQDHIDADFWKIHRLRLSKLLFNETFMQKHRKYFISLFDLNDKKDRGWNRVKKVFTKFNRDKYEFRSYDDLITALRQHINDNVY